jgi:hypothetical protein
MGGPANPPGKAAGPPMSSPGFQCKRRAASGVRMALPIPRGERSAGPTVNIAVAQCTAAGPPLLRPGILALRVPAAGATGPMG